MAVSFKLQYQGQQKEFDYFEGKEVREGGRNVIVTISGKDGAEVDAACVLFVEQMAELGCTDWNGFEENEEGKFQTAYWYEVADKEDADWVKGMYKMVKAEVTALLKQAR